MAPNSFNARLMRLRNGQIDSFTVAIAVSLLIHGFVFGAYQANKKYRWLDKIHLPKWVEKVHRKLATPPIQNPPAVDREPPLMFVQVNPAAVIPEPPKNAKYYSSQSSKAANPDAEANSDIPKISGTQEQIVKTEDTPRSKAFPLQPSAPPSAETQEEEKVKAAQPVGDLALAKPNAVEQTDPGESTRTRPRTLAEARARQPENALAGEKMKQSGGVRQKLEFSSLDAKATPFGAYDAALIAAVQNSWYRLLDNRNFAGERSGKVKLKFNLHPDGRVSGMKVLENSVDELLCLLCQRAIMEPAPFGKWPMEMRRLIGEEREITFTFYYN